MDPNDKTHLNISVTTRDENAECIDREIDQNEPGHNLLRVKRTLREMKKRCD